MLLLTSISYLRRHHRPTAAIAAWATGGLLALGAVSTQAGTATIVNQTGIKVAAAAGAPTTDFKVAAGIPTVGVNLNPSTNFGKALAANALGLIGNVGPTMEALAVAKPVNAAIINQTASVSVSAGLAASARANSYWNAGAGGGIVGSLVGASAVIQGNGAYAAAETVDPITLAPLVGGYAYAPALSELLLQPGAQEDAYASIYASDDRSSQALWRLDLHANGPLSSAADLQIAFSFDASRLQIADTAAQVEARVRDGLVFSAGGASFSGELFSGVYSVTGAPVSYSFGALSTLQAVPEPAALLLMLGGLGVVLAQRRRH